MDAISFKTLFFKESEIKKNWIIIDATNKNLGRLSSTVARLMLGKHKRHFSHHINCGDCVIIINSEKINLTGKKWSNKKYINYTGYPGGKRIISIKDKFIQNPNYIIEKSIKGMLPKNRLGRKILKKKLHVLVGSKHNYNIPNPIYFDTYKKTLV